MSDHAHSLQLCNKIVEHFDPTDPSDVLVLLKTLSTDDIEGIFNILKSRSPQPTTFSSLAAKNSPSRTRAANNAFRTTLFKAILTEQSLFQPLIEAAAATVLHRACTGREASSLVAEINLALTEKTAEFLSNNGPYQSQRRVGRRHQTRDSFMHSMKCLHSCVVQIVRSIVRCVTDALRNEPTPVRPHPEEDELTPDHLVALDLLPALLHFLKQTQRFVQADAAIRRSDAGPTPHSMSNSGGGRACSAGSREWAQQQLNSLLMCPWPPALLLPMVSFFVDEGGKWMGHRQWNSLQKKLVTEVRRHSDAQAMRENFAGVVRAILLLAEQHQSRSTWLAVLRQIIRSVPKACWANVVFVAHLVFKQSISLPGLCLNFFEKLLSNKHSSLHSEPHVVDVGKESHVASSSTSVKVPTTPDKSRRAEAESSLHTKHARNSDGSPLSNYELLRIEKSRRNKEILERIISGEGPLTAAVDQDSSDEEAGTRATNTESTETNMSTPGGGSCSDEELDEFLKMENFSWHDVAIVLMTIDNGFSAGARTIAGNDGFLGSLLLDNPRARSLRNQALRLATALLLLQAGLQISESLQTMGPKQGLASPVTVASEHVLCPSPKRLVLQISHVLTHGQDNISISQSEAGESGASNYDGASLAYAPALVELALSWCEVGGSRSRAHMSQNADASRGGARSFKLPVFDIRRLRSERETESAGESLTAQLCMSRAFLATAGTHLFVLLFGAYPSARIHIMSTIFGLVVDNVRAGHSTTGDTEARTSSVFGVSSLFAHGITPITHGGRRRGPPSGNRHFEDCWQYIGVVSKICHDWRLLNILHQNHAAQVNEWLEQILSLQRDAESGRVGIVLGANKRHPRTRRSHENIKASLCASGSENIILSLVYVLRPLLALDSVCCGTVFSVARKLSGSRSSELQFRAAGIVSMLLVDRCVVGKDKQVEAIGILLLGLRVAPTLSAQNRIFSLIAWIMESKIRTNIARPRQHDAQFTQRSAITSSSLRRQLPTADPSLMSVEAARAVIKATCAQLSHCTAKASNQQANNSSSLSKQAISTIDLVSPHRCLEKVIHSISKKKSYLPSPRRRSPSTGTHSFRLKHDPTRLLQALVSTLTVTKLAVTDFQSDTLFTKTAARVRALCYTIAFDMTHPDRVFKYVLEEGTGGLYVFNPDTTGAESGNEAHREQAVSTSPVRNTPHEAVPSPIPSQQYGILAAFSAKALHQAEVAAAAQSIADVDPSLRAQEVSLPLKWRIVVPLCVPVIELLVGNVMATDDDANVKGLTARLGVKRKADVGLQTFENFAMLYAILPSQVFRQNSDIWTHAEVLSVMEAATATLSGISARGGGTMLSSIEPACPAQRLASPVVLPWETSLRFFERFLPSYEPSLRRLQTVRRPSLLVARFAIDCLLVAVSAWTSEPVLTSMRDQCINATRKHAPSSPQLTMNATTRNKATAILRAAVFAVANCFQKFCLRCPLDPEDLPSNIRTDNISSTVAVEPFVVSAVTTGDANSNPYPYLQGSRWGRVMKRVDLQTVWFELVESLLTICHKLIDGLLPVYCSTSVVRKILGNIIEQTRVHIVRGGEIHDSLPILDYVQRQLGIQSELSGPQAAIDIFAVFIASEVAHEIEVAGVTIFMITRAIKLLEGLSKWFVGGIAHSRRHRRSIAASTKHVVAKSILKVLQRVPIEQPQVLNRLLRFALDWAEPRFALQVAMRTVLSKMTPQNDNQQHHDLSRKPYRQAVSRVVDDESGESDDSDESGDDEITSLGILRTIMTADFESLVQNLHAVPLEPDQFNAMFEVAWSTRESDAKPIACPDKCLDAVTVTLLSHIEDHASANNGAAILTATHSERFDDRTSDVSESTSSRHRFSETSVASKNLLREARRRWRFLQSFVPSTDRVQFRLAYLLLLFVQFLVHQATAASGNLSARFAEFIKGSKFADHLAKSSLNLLRKIRDAVKSSISSSKKMRGKGRQHRPPTRKRKVSAPNNSGRVSMTRTKNDFVCSSLLSTIRSSDDENGAVHEPEHFVPLPMAALFVGFVSCINRWRNHPSCNMAPTLRHKLGLAGDRFDINIQTMLETCISWHDNYADTDGMNEENARLKLIWETLLHELRTRVLGVDSSRVPTNRVKTIRRGGRRRLRSSHPVIDQLLASEKGDDTFADLEGFIATDNDGVDPATMTPAEIARSFRETEAAMGRVPLGEVNSAQCGAEVSGSQSAPTVGTLNAEEEQEAEAVMTLIPRRKKVMPPQSVQQMSNGSSQNSTFQSDEVVGDTVHNLVPRRDHAEPSSPPKRQRRRLAPEPVSEESTAMELIDGAVNRDVVSDHFLDASRGPAMTRKAKADSVSQESDDVDVEVKVPRPQRYNSSHML